MSFRRIVLDILTKSIGAERLMHSLERVFLEREYRLRGVNSPPDQNAYPRSILQRIPLCPWCGSAEREPSSNAFSSESNAYLAAVAQKHGIAAHGLPGMMKGHACLACGTTYCDPWLSPSASQWLFNLGRPQHNAGWGRFYDWLERTDRFEICLFPRAEKIWDYLVSAIGTVRSYGEVGCPFMGLFPYFETLKTPVAETFARYEELCCNNFQCQAHPSFLQQPYILQRLSLWQRKRQNNARWAKQSGSLPKGPENVPSEYYYLKALSRLMWGNNCQAISLSCTTTAAATFNLNITELQKLNKPIDLLGFFNTLDHQDKPLEILTDALDKARYVVVELHDDRDAAKQHLFVINQALVRSAKEKGWNCREFSQAIPPDPASAHDHLYLLSKG